MAFVHIVNIWCIWDRNMLPVMVIGRIKPYMSSIYTNTVCGSILYPIMTTLKCIGVNIVVELMCIPISYSNILRLLSSSGIALAVN